MQIIVNGYPRSGTTWLYDLLADAINCPLLGFYEMETGDTPPRGLDRCGDHVVYKSHAAAQDLRVRIDSRVIYIVRDPRDVLISTVAAWRIAGVSRDETSAAKLREGVQQALDWQLGLICCSGYPAVHGRPWDNHVGFWQRYAHGWCRYEDLCEKPGNEVLRLCGVLGLSVRHEDIAAAVADNDIKKRLAEKAPLVRKGQPGEWREVFTAQQKSQADAMWGDTLKRLGYPRGTGNANDSTALRRSA